MLWLPVGIRRFLISDGIGIVIPLYMILGPYDRTEKIGGRPLRIAQAKVMKTG